MNSVSSLFTTVGIFFLVIILPSILAFWSARSAPNRFWPALTFSLVSVVLAIIAIEKIHLTASRTVNGQLQWYFDSRWVFIVGLATGVVALVYTLYKKKSSAISA